MSLDELSLIPLYIIPGYVALSIRRWVLPSERPDGFQATVSTLIATAVLVFIANLTLVLYQKVGTWTGRWIFIPPEEFFSQRSAFVATMLAVPLGLLWGGISQWSWPLACLEWVGAKLGIEISDHRDPLSSDPNGDIWLKVQMDNGRILTGRLRMFSSHYHRSLAERDLYLEDVIELVLGDDGTQVGIKLDQTDGVLIPGSHISSVQLMVSRPESEAIDKEVESYAQSAAAS